MGISCVEVPGLGVEFFWRGFSGLGPSILSTFLLDFLLFEESLSQRFAQVLLHGSPLIKLHRKCSHLIFFSALSSSIHPSRHHLIHLPEDIDECQQSRCHSDAVCYNAEGSFTCQCRPGYSGDGFQCLPGR